MGTKEGFRKEVVRLTKKLDTLNHKYLTMEDMFRTLTIEHDRTLGELRNERQVTQKLTNELAEAMSQISFKLWIKTAWGRLINHLKDKLEI